MSWSNKRLLSLYCIPITYVLMGLGLWIVGLFAQTRVDANTQIKNLSPVQSVARSQCVGSGTVGTTTWNCAGLQLYKITLRDGTVLGPYVAVPATAQEASLANWQMLPLESSNP